MTDRRKVRDRIRALREKTSARGCTEEEAAAAAAKAAELMREYGLTDADVDIDQAEAPSRTGSGSVRSRLWAAIAHLTNCAAILSDGRCTFFGAGAGPEIAAYLMEVCDRAIDRSVREFRGTTWYKRRRTPKAKRQASDDFVSGMVSRLIERLHDLFRDQMNDAARERAIAARDARPGLREVSMKDAPGRYYAATAQGRAAGADVGLHHAVSAGAAPKAIGGGG